MAGYGSWDDRPWERGEGGRDWERWRRERQRGQAEGEPWRERPEQDLGARGREERGGREEWRGEEAERRPAEWRASGREERGWDPQERRSMDREREGPRQRPEIDPPWVERGPSRRGRDTRGLVEWEDRGPLAWLGDRVRSSGKRPRGPKGYTRSDERIHEEVCERIARSGVDADDVEVRVEKREVTLSGTVGSREEKWWLEDLADDVFGVEEVHNQLRVTRSGPATRGEGAGMPH